jgi:hypothetical protein
MSTKKPQKPKKPSRKAIPARAPFPLEIHVACSPLGAALYEDAIRYVSGGGVPPRGTPQKSASAEWAAMVCDYASALDVAIRRRGAAPAKKGPTS